MTERVFNTTEEINFVEFDGLQVEYVNLDISEEEYTINFNVKNISNLPTDAENFKVQIVPKNDIGVFYLSPLTLNIPTLTPGAEQSASVSSNYMKPVENLSLEKGSEFLIQIIYKHTSKDQDIKYIRIKC